MRDVIFGRTIFALAALAFQSFAVSAQLPPGSYDPTWGQNGRAFVDLGAPTSFEMVGGVSQADGKLIVGGNAAITEACGGIAFARFNLDGSLDTSFGTAGWYTYAPSQYCNGQPTVLQAMAAKSNGYEIGVVGRDQGYLAYGWLRNFDAPDFSWGRDYQVGSTFMARAMAASPYGYDYLVAGYDNREPAGTPGRVSAFLRITSGGYVDTSFGTSGVLRQAFGTESDEAAAVAFDYDGSSWFFAGTARDSGSTTGSDIVIGRFLSNGTLDTAWGSAGKRVMDFHGQDDAALTLTAEWGARLRVGGSAGYSGGRLPALVQLQAGTGEVDTGFGMGDGKRTAFMPGNLDGEFSALLNPGMSYVAAGTAVDRVTGARSVVVYRFDGQGNPFYGFGDQGLAFAAGQANPRGFVSDDPYIGSFYVAGNAAAESTASMTRFDLQGADSTYGARAFAPAGRSGTNDEGGAMAMRPDGSMVLVGQIQLGGYSQSVGGVVRLDGSGARDLGFGSSRGVAYLTPPYGMMGFFPRAVGLYEDGRVVIASTGQGADGLGATMVARLTAKGVRDPQWKGGGDAVFAGTASFAEVMAIVVQPDGAVLVAGRASDGGSYERGTLMRLLDDGSPDPSFGYGGRVVLPSAGSWPPETANGLLLEADGRILVASRGNGPPGNGRLAVMRLLPNGALDPAWGIGGAAYGPEGAAFGIARQGDGKIVAAGDCGAGGDTSCMVRFMPDGQVDTAFGTNGVTQMPLGGGGYNGYVGVALQADGKIVAGGDGYSFTLTRLRSNGAPDESFNGGNVYSLENAQGRSFAMTADGRLVIAGRSLSNGDLAVARHIGGGDDSPDAFTFAAVSGVPAGTLVASAVVTPTGYDLATPVWIDDGQVSFDGCQTWQGTGYIISPGTSLCVRHMSAEQAGGTRTSSVRIGETVATFTSTTTDINTTLTSVPASPSPANVTFAFTSDTGSATFECRLDGATFGPCASPLTIGGLASGPHTFDVRAVSGASVDATPASATFTVDAMAPDTTIISGPDASVAASSASFAFTSDDSAATFECLVDSAPFAACASPLSLSGIAEGTHTFAVRAVDAVGNRDASPAVRTWTVDTRPPDTSLDEGQGPSGVVAASTATFTFRSDEAAATFECRLDGAAYTSCSGMVHYTGLAEGPHTFEVAAIDAAGNRDATPAVRTWTVDTLPPDTTFISAPSGVVSSTSAVVAFESPDGGSFFMCSLDGASFAGCPSPVNLTGLEQGAHSFRVYASDAAGNVDATPATATWIVDTVPPDTTITSGPTGNNNPPSATFTFKSTEAGTFQCRLDGGPWLGCASGVTYSELRRGLHAFEVRALDAGGNVDATPATAVWRSNN
jgi:uncharacterized delta-60 repeat protein